MSGDGHTGPIPENRGRPVCPRRLPLLVASADLGLQVGVGGVGPLTPPVGGESFLKQAANVRRQSRLMRGRRLAEHAVPRSLPVNGVCSLSGSPMCRDDDSGSPRGDRSLRHPLGILPPARDGACQGGRCLQTAVGGAGLRVCRAGLWLPGDGTGTSRD